LVDGALIPIPTLPLPEIRSMAEGVGLL